MKFPPGNKYAQPLTEKFGENAALLQERLSTLHWRPWLKTWAIVLGLLCVTLFAIVFSVRLALIIL